MPIGAAREYCILPAASCLLISAFCLLLSRFSLPCHPARACCRRQGYVFTGGRASPRGQPFLDQFLNRIVNRNTKWMVFNWFIND
jgi:hypothetical protein